MATQKFEYRQQTFKKNDIRNALVAITEFWSLRFVTLPPKLPLAQNEQINEPYIQIGNMIIFINQANREFQG